MGRIWACQGKTHTPAVAIHSQEGSQRYGSFPWGARDLNSTSGTPLPRSCTGEMSSQDNWLWKTNGEYAQENYRTAGKRKPALKGLMSRLSQPKNQHRNIWLRNAWTIGERSLLILRHLPERQKTIETLLGDWVTGRCYLCNLRLPYSYWHRRGLFWNSLLLAPVGIPCWESPHHCTLAGPPSWPSDSPAQQYPMAAPTRSYSQPRAQPSPQVPHSSCSSTTTEGHKQLT